MQCDIHTLACQPTVVPARTDQRGGSGAPVGLFGSSRSSAGVGSWTTGRRRWRCDNLFHDNNLLMSSRSRPLSVLIVLNRMPAGLEHRPWTDLNRGPRVPQSRIVRPSRAVVCCWALTRSERVEHESSVARSAERLGQTVGRTATHWYSVEAPNADEYPHVERQQGEPVAVRIV